MKIISGTSNTALAEGIANLFGTKLVDVENSQFANGERRVWVKEEVRGQKVAIVQSLSEPTDQHIIELLLMIDALDRVGARHINVVIPWLGYSLQDKVFRDGEPIAAKVIANLISNSGVRRAFLLDLHNSSTPGFFSIPTQHLSAMSVFVTYAEANFKKENLVVASPDFGGLKRARVFAEKLGVELVNVDKQRDLSTGETKATNVSGNVNGKIVIVFDDVINAGGTVVNCAEILKARGAAEVHFFATHGLFADNGQAKINASMIDTVIVTNSIPSMTMSASGLDLSSGGILPSGATQNAPSKIHYLDSSQLFADALRAWLE